MSHRNIAVSSAFLAGQSMVLNAISLFATAYIIRKLGAGAYGEWATAAGLTAANGAIANFGLRPLFVRGLAQARAETVRQLLAEQLGVRLVLGGLAASLAIVSSLALRYPHVVVLCVAVSSASLILTVLWTVFGDFLQAFEKFKTYAVVSFIAGLVLTLSSVAVAWAGGGAVSLAVAYVTGPVVTAVMFGVFLYRSGDLVAPVFSSAAARRLLTESRSIAGSQLIGTLRDRSEQLIVPKLVGIAPFGYFAGSVMPADRLYVFPDALSTAFYPRIAGAPSAEAASLVAVRLVTWVALGTSAAGALLYVAAPVIAYVLYPSAAATSTAIIRVSCLALPAAGLAAAFTYALQGTGQHRTVARRSALLSICGFVTTAACVAAWGLTGAAWAWVLKHVFMAAGLMRPFAQAFGNGRVVMTRVAIVLVTAAAVAWLAKIDEPRFVETILRGTFVLLAVAPLTLIFRGVVRK